MRFHRFLLGSFLAASLGLIFAANWAHRKILVKEHIAADLPVPAEIVDRSALTPEEAKHSGLFWVFGPHGSGLALDILRNPPLFDSVFPGYADAAADAPLWTKYFQQLFDTSLYSPLLSRRDDDATVGVSWTGSFDLYNKYGADIIILGSSETYIQLPPAALRDKLKSPGARILTCATGSMTPAMVALSAQTLAEGGRKARLAIWGYSLWGAYRTRRYQDELETKKAAHRKWRERDGKSRLADLPALLRWDNLVKLNLQKAWEARQKTSLSSPGMTSAMVDGFELRQNSHQGINFFPEKAAADPRIVLDMAGSITPNYAEFEGISDGNCDMTQASAEIDRVLSDLLKTAERVLLFMPPTTPLQTECAPKCYVAGVKAMLKAKAGGRVQVETGDWISYGLSYLDYLRPDERSGFSRIDINHANFKGSLKIASKIARLVERDW